MIILTLKFKNSIYKISKWDKTFAVYMNGKGLVSSIYITPFQINKKKRPMHMANLAFDRVGIINQWEKSRLFSTRHWDNWLSIWGKIKWDSLLILHTKINSVLFKKLNMKSNILSFLKII